MKSIRCDSMGAVLTTALEEIVTCQCGHAIGLHDSLGCKALRPRHCACSFDRNWVIETELQRTAPDSQRFLRRL